MAEAGSVPLGEEGEGGYFILDSDRSPGSVHSGSSLPMASAATMASLTALQYLPIPLLVLSSLKTIVLANEAMGRLLGIDFESTAAKGLSISESLRGQNMGALGIDIIQDGSPILVTWEVDCQPTDSVVH